MDIDRLLALKEVRELFPADEKGKLPEGSCLLLSAMEELDFPPGPGYSDLGAGGGGWNVHPYGGQRPGVRLPWRGD